MSSPIQTLAFSFLIFSTFLYLSNGSGFDDIRVSWGDGRGKILDNGKQLTLSLDQYSGSGFESKNEFMFGRLDCQIKLVAGNSAGTVTTFYLSSQGPTHDEIDFEFLGNLSGDPYTLHTNVFAEGKGNREQQFHLWFDPTKDFHTYSILWNPKHVIFLVDNVPIRDFKNHESNGVSFPKNQPMRLYSSLWNADDWATRGGLVKTDWSKAPFTAYYRNFNASRACVWSMGRSSCGSADNTMDDSDSSTKIKEGWYDHELDDASYRRMRWVQRKYMIYNYCSDVNRFPGGVPKECKLRSKFSSSDMQIRWKWFILLIRRLKHISHFKISISIILQRNTASLLRSLKCKLSTHVYLRESG